VKALAYRFILNFWPCIRGTGGRVARISDDFREIDIRLPLNWRTRNRVGTIFGGSIYASIDPIYMLMLMEILGRDFIVWDKGAAIKFKRPGTRTMYAHLRLSAEFTDDIKRKVLAQGELTFDLPVHYVDEAGLEIAEIQKTLYVATKPFYREKIAKRDSIDKAGVKSPSLPKSSGAT
jgi:acyl-coenzyme A thioesterase PaaI-like protein